jgi:hypothetical protein
VHLDGVDEGIAGKEKGKEKEKEREVSETREGNARLETGSVSPRLI